MPRHAPRPGATAVDQWALDPARTRISFSVDAFGFPRTEGEFHNFDGRIAVDLEHPALSRVMFHVQAQSIDAGSTLLSDYLRSAAFFDTGRFAEIAFVSTKVDKIDEQTVRVAGDLTMLGVTRPVTVNVEVRRQGARRMRNSTSKPTRPSIGSKFGMSAGYPLISRDVDLIVASEFAEH